MEHFNYHYTNPTEITLAVIIKFFIYGDFLVPLFVFSLFAWLGYLCTYTALQGVALLIGRIIKFKKIDDAIHEKIIEKEFLIKEGNEYKKGLKYEFYPQLLDRAYYSDFNLHQLLSIINAINFSALMVLHFCVEQNSLHDILFWVIFLYYILFFIPMYCILYNCIIDKQDFYEDIYFKIEKQTTNNEPT